MEWGSFREIPYLDVMANRPISGLRVKGLQPLQMAHFESLLWSKVCQPLVGPHNGLQGIACSQGGALHSLDPHVTP